MNGETGASGGAEGGPGGVSVDEAGMDIVVEPMQGSPRMEDEERGVEGGGDKAGPTSMATGLHDSQPTRPQPGVGEVVRVDVGTGGLSLDASLSPHTGQGMEGSDEEGGIEVLDGAPSPAPDQDVPVSWAASRLQPPPPIDTTWEEEEEEEEEEVEVVGGGAVMRHVFDDDASVGSNEEEREDRGPGSPLGSPLAPLPSSSTGAQQGAAQAHQGQSHMTHNGGEDMEIEVEEIVIGEPMQEEEAMQGGAVGRARAVGLGSGEEDEDLREALAASKELISPGELGRMARRETQAAQAFAQSHMHKLSHKVRRRVQSEALEAQEALSSLTKCLTAVAVGEDDYVLPTTHKVQLVGQVGWEEFCTALDKGLKDEGASREMDRVNLLKASTREQLYLKARTLLQDKHWQPLKCDGHGVEKEEVDEPSLWHRLGHDASLHGPLPSTLTSLLVDKRRQACRVMLLPRDPKSGELLDLGHAITHIIPASIRELQVELSKCGHTMPELAQAHTQPNTTASAASSAASTPRNSLGEGPSAVSIDQLLASNTKARRKTTTDHHQQSYWLPAAIGVLDQSVLGALREHIKRGLSQPQGPWGAGKAKDLDRATKKAVTHATKALHKLLYAVSTREGEERVDLSGVSFPLDLPTARALIQQMLGLRNGLMSLARDGLAYCDSSKQLTVDEYTAWTELTGLLVNPAPPSLEGAAASPAKKAKPLVLHHPIRGRLQRFLAQSGDGGDGDGRASLLAVDQDLHSILPSLPKPPPPPKGPPSPPHHALHKPEKKRDHKCRYVNELQALLDSIPPPTKTTALASTSAILEEFLAHEARLNGEGLEESGSEGEQSNDSSFKASALDESEDDLDEDLSSSSSSGEEEVEEVVGTTIFHKKKRRKRDKDKDKGDRKPRAKPTGEKKPKAPSGKDKDSGKPTAKPSKSGKLPRRQSAPSALPSSLLSGGGVKKPSASGGPSGVARPTATSTSTSTGAASGPSKPVNIQQILQQHDEDIDDVDSDDSIEFSATKKKKKKDASGGAKRDGGSKRPREPAPSTAKPSSSMPPAPLPQPKRRKSETPPLPSGDAVNGGKKRSLPSSSSHRPVPPPVDIVPPKAREGPVMPGDTLIDLGRLNHSPSGTRPVLRHVPVVDDAMHALQYGNVSKLEVQAIMEREGKGARDGADMGQDLYRHWGSWLAHQTHVDIQGDATLDQLRRWPRALLRVMVQPKLTLTTPAEVSGNLGKAATQSKVKEVLATLRDTHKDTIDTIWNLFLRFLSEKKHWKPSGHVPIHRPLPRVPPPAPSPSPRPSLPPPLPPPLAFPSRPSSSARPPAPSSSSSRAAPGPKCEYVFNPTMRTQLEIYLSASQRMSPEGAASERRKVEKAMKELAHQVHYITTPKPKEEARQERRTVVQLLSEEGMATPSRLTNLAEALEKLTNRVKREGGIQRVTEGTFHFLKRLQAALRGLAKHMTERQSPHPLPHQGPPSSFTIPLTRPREPIPVRPLPPLPPAPSHAPVAAKQEEEEEEDGWGPELDLSAPLEVDDSLPSPAFSSDHDNEEEELAVLWEGGLWVQFVGFVRAWAVQMKLQWEGGQDEAIALCAHEWLRQQLASTHTHTRKMKDGHQLHGVLKRAGLCLADTQPLHARLLLRYGLSRLASEHHAT